MYFSLLGGGFLALRVKLTSLGFAIARLSARAKWGKNAPVKRLSLVPFAASILVLAAACEQTPPPVAPKPAPAAPAASGAPPAVSAQPTAEEAKSFVAQVDKDLRRLWVQRDRGNWVNLNFITDDTEALSAAGEEATAAYVTEAITKAHRFDSVKGIDPDTARQLLLLKLAQVVPAPSNADERRELAELQSAMNAIYGKGQFCPQPGSAHRSSP